MTSALVERLEEHAGRRPAALAVREFGESGGERSVTWRELRDAVRALEARLRNVRPGPGVLLIGAPNRIELLVAILGGLQADASVLPVSPEVPPLELVATARRARAAIAIGEPAVLAALTEVVSERIPIDALAAGPHAHGGAPRAGGAGSILLATSATTGLPRLVRRDGPALDAVGASCARAVGIDSSDVMLVTLPLYHSYGIDQGVLTAITAGCAIELHRHFDPIRTRSALLERGISVFPAVPVMFDALARQVRPGRPAPRLRRAYSAGSPLPRRVFDQFAGAFEVGIGQIYGATEFGSVTFNDPDAADFDPEAAGRPLDGVELRILDARVPDLDCRLAPETEGQVAVAARSMMRGYLDGPPADIDRGFLLTGDLGRLDASGCLRLTGRLRLLVDVGGIKVNPAEVERVLMRHPAVREVVVLSVPFTDTTARLKAIVVPEPGCELRSQELRRFAREHLIHYKVPRTIEIRETVPRSATGKILRKPLEDELGAGALP